MNERRTGNAPTAPTPDAETAKVWMPVWSRAVRPAKNSMPDSESTVPASSLLRASSTASEALVDASPAMAPATAHAEAPNA
eukprot:scaffold27246_cov114-Isochrysis_galbana.AAC.7